MNPFNLLMDFILPRFCCSCNKTLAQEENILCSACFNSIKLVEQERLTIEFDRKFSNEKLISGFTTPFVFEKEKVLQTILHELKYSGRFRIGIYLGEKIGEILRDQILSWKPDLIIPVPLHHQKKSERGFNQSYYIAKGISKEFNYQIDRNVLRRKRYTNTQTTLTLSERKVNVCDAFTVRKPERIQNKKILLVDDVITTGATVSECAKILLNHRAEKVFALSAAIADY